MSFLGISVLTMRPTSLSLRVLSSVSYATTTNIASMLLKENSHIRDATQC